MRKKSLTIIIFTIVMGAFAFFLRWLQTQNFYDEGTFLVRRVSTYNTLVICVSLLALVGIALLIIIGRRGLSGPLELHSLRFNSRFFAVLSIVACALLFIGGAMLFVEGLGSRFFDVAVGFLFVAASCALFTLTRLKNWPSCKNLAFFCAVIPVVALGFWLFAEYKLSSSNPQTWMFAPQILAIAFSTIGFFYYAGATFGQIRPIKTVFIALSASFFCMMTVMDSGSTAKSLILASLALIQILLACSIIHAPAKTVDMPH